MSPRDAAARCLGAAATLLVLSAVLFIATDLLPGDAAGVAAGADATDRERAGIRERLGLDRPLPARYLAWLGRALRGDLGTSAAGGRPVAGVVADRFGNSVLLVVIAVAVIAVLATVLGLTAGLRAGRPVDRLLSSATVTLVALPEFLLATALLVLFAQHWRLFPAVSLLAPGESPLDRPELLVLPVASLVLGGVGTATRLLRAAAVTVCEGPAVEQARLDGVRGLPLALAYVLPAASGPAVQGLAVLASGLLGGGVVVESLFNYPGIGSELARAVAYRDTAMVQGIGLTLAASVLAVLLAGDLLSRLLDVRTRPAARRRAAGGAR
ncbi:ABC transporter permease [Streptomyces sp. RFCAC02]|uniref:ABC transporter permease n=1 Tax=Streptomyces sp. RFCAC02 TaxID=2499143 RepID=UPI0010229D39|nr:ABC transporter permease [Streptomyces sp. RFCAC02]